MTTRIARIVKIDKSTDPFTEEFVSPILMLNFALETAAKWNLRTWAECRDKNIEQYIFYQVLEEVQKFGEEEVTKP